MYPISKILVIIDTTWSSSLHLANNHKFYEKLPRIDERLKIISNLFDFFYFSTVIMVIKTYDSLGRLLHSKLGLK